MSISVPSATAVAASCTFTVRRRCEDGCPVVRVNTPGLLQQSHVRYCWWTDAAASSGPKRRSTSDHRRSTARPHIACSPAVALASSPPTSSVQAGRASVQSAAWASPTVLDGRLSTRCRCGRRQLRSSDAVTFLVPRTRTCLGDRAFGVAGPRLWNALPISLRQPHLSLGQFRRALKTHLFDCVCRA